MHIVGVIQLQCKECQQVLTIPNNVVIGLQDKEDVEGAASRLLFDINEQPPRTNKKQGGSS